MVVAFPFAFGGAEKWQNLALGECFVRQLRKRKEVYIVQMTDEATRSIDGVHEVYRRGSEPLGLWHFLSMCEFPAKEYLRLDYDCVIMDDVSEVFTRDFDIAISDERPNKVNCGAVFVKNKDVMRDALVCYLARTKRDNWDDIQKAIAMTVESGKFKTEFLKKDVYNAIAGKDDGAFPEGAKIVHYKGNARKKFMLARCGVVVDI